MELYSYEYNSIVLKFSIIVKVMVRIYYLFINEGCHKEIFVNFLCVSPTPLPPSLSFFFLKGKKTS